ncbi:MAG: IS1 family transposase [Gemmatimonadetes bacterium]|nr:IS1 family transposase [Gemmatimonadota bacterium]
MNRLSPQRRTQILTALVEGNSIRSTCRMTGAAKATVLRLLEQVGEACTEHHDKIVRNVPAKTIQMDEIWSFCGAKSRNVPPEQRGMGRGDLWTWVALDPETKLVLSWLVGPRSAEAGEIIAEDLAGRLANRVQISTDAYNMYAPAIERAFGWGGADYAQIEKQYASTADPRSPERRYSPGVCIGAKARWVMGKPVNSQISTSIVERKNLTLRMEVGRLRRLTLAFSKKAENHAHAVALHMVHYNFCRLHGTLTKRNKGIHTTPGMEAGLADRVYKMADLVLSLT